MYRWIERQIAKEIDRKREKEIVRESKLERKILKDR